MPMRSAKHAAGSSTSAQASAVGVRNRSTTTLNSIFCSAGRMRWGWAPMQAMALFCIMNMALMG